MCTLYDLDQHLLLCVYQFIRSLEGVEGLYTTSYSPQTLIRFSPIRVECKRCGYNTPGVISARIPCAVRKKTDTKTTGRGTSLLERMSVVVDRRNRVYVEQGTLPYKSFSINCTTLAVYTVLSR